MGGLVIGSNGQVGRCLQRILEARYVDRGELDLRDFSRIHEVIAGTSPSFIVNVAAYTAVDAAESDKGAAEVVNGLAVGEIAKAAKQLDIPLVHLSTDYVYSGDSNRPYLESDPTQPINEYGRSKLYGELELAAVDPGKWWILRTSWVFSEFGGNFVKSILRLSNERESLQIVSDQVGRPTYAGHIADVVRAVVEGRYSLPNGTYHCASAGATSWFDFARAIVGSGHELGLISNTPQLVPIPSREYRTIAPRPAYSVLDTQKLERATGWVPPTWQEGLERTLLALRKTA